MKPTKKTKDYLATAIAKIRIWAIAQGRQISGGTRKKVRDAHDATEGAWKKAAAKTSGLPSHLAFYIREQPIWTIFSVVAAGLLMSVLLLFARIRRKRKP